MKRWLWHLDRIASGVGPLGFLGLGLVVAAALIYSGPIISIGQEIRDLQTSLSAARTSPAPSTSADREEQQLARFYDFFPPANTLTQQLHLLHEVTSDQQLAIDKVDYKLSTVSGTALKRYDVAYSLVTDYPTLRVYLAALLAKLPYAALKDVSLQRYTDDAPLIEAKLNLVLYLRADRETEEE